MLYTKIGHTKLMHGYLIDKKKSPTCCFGPSLGPQIDETNQVIHFLKQTNLCKLI